MQNIFVVIFIFILYVSVANVKLHLATQLIQLPKSLWSCIIGMWHVAAVAIMHSSVTHMHTHRHTHTPYTLAIVIPHLILHAFQFLQQKICYSASSIHSRNIDLPRRVLVAVEWISLQLPHMSQGKFVGVSPPLVSEHLTSVIRAIKHCGER